MSLRSKIEAVIYASEEPVTLAQLVVLLTEEAQSELDALAARQAQLPLEEVSGPAETLAAPAGVSAGTVIAPALDEGSPTASVPSDEMSSETSAIGEAEALETAAASELSSELGDVTESTTEGAVPADLDVPHSHSEAAAHLSSAAVANTETDKRYTRERERVVRDYLRSIVDALIREYADADRGLEIREVAGGFRFGTKPEYHDAVRGFVKSLKPALKLTLQALETLAVVAYKQPVTAAEISEIRGVDSAGVLGGLLTRKLIQTAGRKQVIGRPMLYKTTKEFLVRFGLRDIQELPSMEEFERMAGELAEQEDLPMEATESMIERANARGDAEHIREANDSSSSMGEGASPAEEAGRSSGGTTGDDNHGAAPEPGSEEVRANSTSSPRSEAEPESTEQDPA